MATITEVAKAAGVSTATISRVINNTGYVKQETREKVLTIINQLDYHPNASGQNLRLNRTNIIMVITSDVRNPFIAGVMRSIEFAARSYGYSVILHEYTPNQDSAAGVESFISARKIDGMIFLTAEAKVKEFQYISEKITTVLACEYIEHLDIPSVSIDNISAAIEVIQYLVSIGHRDILFLNGDPDSFSTRDRLRGYRIALEQNGVEFRSRMVIRTDCSPEHAYQVVHRAFDEGVQFSTVFCSSDVMAIGAMKAIREKGLKIPADISVVGFDDIEFAAFADPPLTTVYQPGDEIGELAVKMWMDVYAGKTVDYPVKIAHQLRIRDSCAAKRS